MGDNKDARTRGSGLKADNGGAKMLGNLPGPNDTVVRPVSTKEATLSSNIGPGFVKVSTPTCICGGIGGLSACREKALPDKMFESGIQVGETNLGPGVFAAVSVEKNDGRSGKCQNGCAAKCGSKPNDRIRVPS
jgi:hypothetical protein